VGYLIIFIFLSFNPLDGTKIQLITFLTTTFDDSR